MINLFACSTNSHHNCAFRLTAPPASVVCVHTAASGILYERFKISFDNSYYYVDICYFLFFANAFDTFVICHFVSRDWSEQCSCAVYSLPVSPTSACTQKQNCTEVSFRCSSICGSLIVPQNRSNWFSSMVLVFRVILKNSYYLSTRNLPGITGGRPAGA
jgi:hypothetical protein